MKELHSEFQTPPDVVLVWAQPELGRLWFIEKLKREGLVQHVLGRDKLDCEGPGLPTTYPESVNIRKGLEFVKAHYPPDSYVVMQAADIWPRDHTYLFIENHMQAGENAVLFHWQNSIMHSGVWHTNFFAVCLDERYWPPVSVPGHPDVLERHWGKELAETSPPGVVQSHNYESKRFFHKHVSEADDWPVVPLEGAAALGCFVRGWKPWTERLCDWVLGVFRLRRYS